jgi:hypothetical protein
MHWQRPASLGISILFLTLVSCFETPIREDLRLRFLPNGAVVATSTVRIQQPSGEVNPLLNRRLAEARQAIQEGTDVWGARFAATKPDAERFSWEKSLGEISQGTRSALVTEPAGLVALFGDTSLAVSYEVDPERGLAELSIAPGPSTRATRKQREETERTLEQWTAALADYLAAGQDLYAYLNQHPERAAPCFSKLFGEVVTADGKEVGEPTPEEQQKLDRLDEAMKPVLAILDAPQGADHSPDEVSQLVYDPFPARLTVKLPGAPMGVEGFQPGKDGTLIVERRSLWEALRSLEGRWLSPDPVLFYVYQSQKGTLADLERLARKPRTVVAAEELPSAREVRTLIEEKLKPAPLYRASWKIRPDDETPFRWEEGEAP